tara:strand:+ start:2264 stop:2719 length:456 start_codon:yes stop_codon:yes gene_type:complete
MSENIEFNKQVFGKNAYKKIIDTSFKQLGVKPTPELVEDQPTVNDFFRMYNDMFYDIPEVGNINSHEYIIKKSSEYIGFEENNEIIAALQNEISKLRTELLDTQKQLIELPTTDTSTENGFLTSTGASGVESGANVNPTTGGGGSSGGGGY